MCEYFAVPPINKVCISSWVCISLNRKVAEDLPLQFKGGGRACSWNVSTTYHLATDKNHIICFLLPQVVVLFSLFFCLFKFGEDELVRGVFIGFQLIEAFHRHSSFWSKIFVFLKIFPQRWNFYLVTLPLKSCMCANWPTRAGFELFFLNQRPDCSHRYCGGVVIGVKQKKKQGFCMPGMCSFDVRFVCSNVKHK